LPIVGVNTFLRKNHVDELGGAGYLVRATDDEKNAQIEALDLFKCNHVHEAPLALQRLKQVVRSGANTFAELMDTVRYCSLGQITGALCEVGGQYRRRL
jgi:methylmalonyl-CoA mutase